MAKYSDMGTLDLRMIQSVAQAKEVEEISDIGTLLLPKTLDPETSAAVMAIPKSDIGTTYYLDPEDELRTINGEIFLTDSDFSKEHKTILLVNGIAVVKEISPETTGSIICNGILVVRESMRDQFNVEIMQLNGVKHYIDFDDISVHQNQCLLDADMLEYLEPKTLLFVGNKLDVAENVTSQMLKEKQLVIYVGNKLRCYPQAAGYLRAKAFVGNKVIVRGADEDKFEKDEWENQG